MNHIKLSDHFTYKRLLRFVAPSVFMMIFTSVYGVVDGIFVSNFAGGDAFAAVNLIFPFLMAIGAIGFMLGAGGSAIVAKTLGEGDGEAAKRYFSFFVYVTFGAGATFSLLGEALASSICELLGATGKNEFLFPLCVRYVRICLIGMPFFMLQCIFHTFFATAEKPHLGFIVTVIAGVTNIVLDFLFVFVFGWGITGAAAATVTSEFLGGTLPIFYFARKNPTSLRLVKCGFYGKTLLKACGNGLSEFANDISGSLVSMLYNFQLLKYVGAAGVSAYGVLMYVNFIFIAMFIGYSIASAQIVGFNFGANNREELKNVFKKSAVITFISGAAMCLSAELLAPVFAGIFAGGDQAVYSLTCRAFLFTGFMFLFCGFGIFSSAFFTALSNGLVSLIISLLRTIAFQATAVITLPLLFGAIGFDPLDGIWCAGLFSEVMAFVVTLIFLAGNRKKYGYL